MSGSNDFSKLRGRSVFILTPIYREASHQYSQSLLETIIAFGQLGIQFGLRQIVGDAMLPRARNQLVSGFLATDAQDALLIDADMQWKPADLLRLLMSDQLMIGAPYRRRQQEMPESDPNSWCIRFPPRGTLELREDSAGALEVEGAGTGFLKVNRKVFDRLIAANADWKAPGSVFMTAEERKWYYRFFRFPDQSDDQGEDYYFCRGWRELGGTIWIDPEITVGHVGSYVYRGSIRSILRRADESSKLQARRYADP